MENRIFRLRTVGGQIDIFVQKNMTLGLMFELIRNKPYVMCPLVEGGREMLFSEAILGIQPLMEGFTEADAESLMGTSSNEIVEEDVEDKSEIH